MRTDDGFELVVADIPGLIEGALEGKGLGHRFLRHVERARALVVLCDLADPLGRTPAEQQRVLLDELGNYQPRAARPAPPGDRLPAPTSAAQLDRPAARPAARRSTGCRVSSVTGEGLPGAGGRRWSRLVREARQAEPVREAFVIHRPEPEGFAVAAGGRRRLAGGRAGPVERAVALSDLTNLEALDYARDRLNRMGVDRALVRAGVRDGDTVRIGGFTFDYAEDEW